MKVGFDDSGESSVARPVYEGALRRQPMEPLLLAGLVITLVLHGGAFAGALFGGGQHGCGAQASEKPIELNVMVTQIVRKGVPRKKELMPQRYEPPKATAPIKGPVLTEDVHAKAAVKEKPRDKKADEDKLLKELAAKIRKDTNNPPTNNQPEGMANGSEAGTANTAAEGNPCATAIHNAILPNWKVAEVVQPSVLSKLSARMQIKLARDGTLSDAKIVTSSRNNFFDNSLLEVVEQVGKSGETRAIVSKECKPGKYSLRFEGASVK